MLVWQHLVGIELHWLVIAMALIVLLAVGSDYNLLLVARFKEEVHAGIKTGIVGAIGETGAVVTTAGRVFAFTMASFVFNDLRMVGQFGTTVGIGLLFDTLIVRSLMMPSTTADPWAAVLVATTRALQAATQRAGGSRRRCDFRSPVIGGRRRRAIERKVRSP